MDLVLSLLVIAGLVAAIGAYTKFRKKGKTNTNKGARPGTFPRERQR